MIRDDKVCWNISKEYQSKFLSCPRDWDKTRRGDHVGPLCTNRQTDKFSNYVKRQKEQNLLAQFELSSQAASSFSNLSPLFQATRTGESWSTTDKWGQLLQRRFFTCFVENWWCRQRFFIYITTVSSMEYASPTPGICKSSSASKSQFCNFFQVTYNSTLQITTRCLRWKKDGKLFLFPLKIKNLRNGLGFTWK